MSHKDQKPPPKRRPMWPVHAGLAVLGVSAIILTLMALTR